MPSSAADSGRGARPTQCIHTAEPPSPPLSGAGSLVSTALSACRRPPWGTFTDTPTLLCAGGLSSARVSDLATQVQELRCLGVLLSHSFDHQWCLREWDGAVLFGFFSGVRIN